MIIRKATLQDAPAILQIYAPYVLHETATFEYEVPTLQDFQTRMTTIMEDYPYFVCCVDDHIIGYCYASKHHARAAYQWNVELSIYIDHASRHAGIGKILYQILLDTLSLQNVVNAYACITYPNHASIAMHEKLGFHKIAHFANTGYKFQRWLDVVWLEKKLNDPQHLRPLVNICMIHEAEIQMIIQNYQK